jgi:pilus assembly protein CpaF
MTDNGRVTGRFRPTGIRPKFYERLRVAGMPLAAQVFQTIVEIN